MGKKTKKKTDDAMNREQQQLIFELLAAQAAADGRGDMLLGDGMRLARPVFSRAVSGDVFPRVYLEFPLLGTPSFDLLVGYENTLRKDGLFTDADSGAYAYIALAHTLLIEHLQVQFLRRPACDHPFSLYFH